MSRDAAIYMQAHSECPFGLLSAERPGWVRNRYMALLNGEIDEAISAELSRLSPVGAFETDMRSREGDGG